MGRLGMAAKLLGAALLCGSLGGCGAELRWQPRVEVARGAGERGAWQQNESRYDFVDDPTAAWSAGGDLAVVWVDQRRKAVLFQRFAAQGQPQGAPVDVSRLPDSFSWLPRVAWGTSHPQRVHVLWQEILFTGGSHGGDMLIATSEDGGRSFAPPVNLSNSPAGDGKGRINQDVWHNGSYDLAVDAAGNVLVAWTEYEGRLWFSRSRDGGRGFSAPLLVAGDPAAPPARGPTLAAGPGGTVALAWSIGEAAAGDIHIALSADGGGSFGALRRVAFTAGYSDAPRLAFAPDGVLHLVHAESRGGPFDTVHAIRHLRSTDGGRSFGASREISAPHPKGFGAAMFPAIGIDARGRLLVAWELLERTGGPPRALAIAASADAVRFSRPELVPGSAAPAGGFNGSTQGWLMKKLAVRPDGAFAVVNSHFHPGVSSRIWLVQGALP